MRAIHPNGTEPFRKVMLATIANGQKRMFSARIVNQIEHAKAHCSDEPGHSILLDLPFMALHHDIAANAKWPGIPTPALWLVKLVCGPSTSSSCQLTEIYTDNATVSKRLGAAQTGLAFQGTGMTEVSDSHATPLCLSSRIRAEFG